jgi:hypothetical protein
LDLLALLATTKPRGFEIKKILRDFIGPKSKDKDVELFKALKSDNDEWMLSVIASKFEKKIYISIKKNKIKIRTYPMKKEFTIPGENINKSIIEEILLEEINNYKIESKGK